MQQFLSVALNSLLAAGLYATMAYGLAVIYGVMRIINLAHAGVMMLGAYVTYALFTRFALDPFLGLVVIGRYSCYSASGSFCRMPPTSSGRATRSRS